MLKKKVVLLIAPHPDDIEFFASEACIQSINLGYETHQLLMTCDEYGTKRDEFKGKRIQAIRRAEMINASKCYGTDEKGQALLHLHWANYIDGHVPFNSESVNRLKSFILKIKPDIILGPDPFYYIDAHRDHKATAKNYYLALKRMDPISRPRIMLYYQSILPDLYLRKKNDSKKTYYAWKSHRSQIIYEMDVFRKRRELLFFFQRIPKNSLVHRVESYRKVRFDTNLKKPNLCGMFLFQKIFRNFDYGSADPRLFIPTPTELGLDLNPKAPIE